MKSDLLVMEATTFGICVRDNRFDWTSGNFLKITAPLCLPLAENVGENPPFGSSDPPR